LVVTVTDNDEQIGLVPRGGRAGEGTVLAAWALPLLLVSPVTVVVAAVTVRVVLGQVSRGWRDICVAGVSVTGVVGVLLGLQVSVSGVPTLWMWLVETGLLGVPLGVTAGCGAVGLLERWAGAADWHPVEQRRRAVEEVRAARRTQADKRPDMVARCDAKVLGVYEGGDLAPWVRMVRRGFRVVARYVALPKGEFPAMGLIGESGSGKTWTVKRLNWLWAHQDTRVIFADFKGSDRKLPVEVIAAYLDARPDADCRVWPAQSLDIWRGDASEIVGRLLQVQTFTEPFYAEAAKTAVRRAVEAPRMPRDGLGSNPPRDSEEFLRRLDLGELERAYKGTPWARDVEALRMPQIMEGVRMRYAAFFAALRGRFDHGFSWDDADLSVLSIPTLAEPDDAMAAARIVLADFGAYCLNRKPRRERAVLVVDEFSAVTPAAAQVIDLAERVRDANGQIVVCVQNYEGLGRDPGERSRMLDALQPGGIIVHRTGNPADVLRLAGTQHKPALSWTLNGSGRTGHGTVKMDRNLSVDPDDVRRLKTGQAFVVTHGRALKMSVLPVDIDPVAERRARMLLTGVGVPSC
jgi:hypothetical protein